MRDFTLAAYEKLLQAVNKAKLPVYGVRKWVAAPPARGILLRHDIDRRPANSLLMARLEAKYGVRATYYCRILPGIFDANILKTIAGLGHEIGYHYEDLALAKGDHSEALALFERHLDMFRGIAPVDTIAMHGSPLSPHDNRELWKHADFARFGIKAEAFLSVDYTGIYYVTDTGRTWSETRANLRDRVEGALTAPVETTVQLATFLTTHAKARFAIVSHPERWDDAILPWVGQLSKDCAINAAKRVLSLARRPAL